MAERGRKLILVRHSAPEMVAGVPASQWHLSFEGRRRCQALARRLADHDLASVITSLEPKAVETGQIVADALGLPLETAPGLHEHERGVVRSVGSREEFQAQVIRLFARPAELVFGRETADQAHDRFSTAIRSIVDQHRCSNLAIVSHGTVMTLLIARANDFDPAPFWQSLGLPAFAVLTLPYLKLSEVVTEVRET